MGIVIEDAKKILSQHQKQKIKTMVSTYLSNGDGAARNLDGYMMREVLPKITFLEGGVYNRIRHWRDETTGHVHLCFEFVNVEDTKDTKRRLRERLRQKSFLRKNSDDERSRLWKVCEDLRKNVPKTIKIPDPNEIVNERGIFEGLLEKMPNSALKGYIQDCLNTL